MKPIIEECLNKGRRPETFEGVMKSMLSKFMCMCNSGMDKGQVLKEALEIFISMQNSIQQQFLSFYNLLVFANVLKSVSFSRYEEVTNCIKKPSLFYFENF